MFPFVIIYCNSLLYTKHKWQESWLSMLIQLTPHKCGHVDKRNRNIDDFCCKKCGYRSHADVNAAINIESSERTICRGDEKQLVSW